ncbi:MAG: SDR family NAD(P)-dependent oxidoreductase [Waddliaceae bacterium]
MKEYAHCLLAFIQHFSSQEEELHIDLADLAYTLQVGREAMEVRVGMIVHSMEELETKLQAFINEEEDVEDVYQGQVKRNQEALAVFAADEDMVKTIDVWIRKRKYKKLLDLWVKGLIFDWNKLYDANKPSLISAPTYPFARNRYWFKTKTLQEDKGNSLPIPQESTSSFSGQSTSFKMISSGQIELANAEGLSFSFLPNKPQEIALSSLSTDRSFLDSNRIDLPKEDIPLSLATDGLSDSNIQDKNPATSTEIGMTRESLQQALIVSLAEVLYMQSSDIDTEKPFVDMGLDSVLGVEWVNIVNKKYQLSVDATKVYDYPNIAKFVGFLENELKLRKKEGKNSLEGSQSSGGTKVRDSGKRAAIPNEASLNKHCISPTPHQDNNSEFSSHREPVAIIGMSGRYPGAPNLVQYWHNLAHAKQSIQEIPGSRWDVNEYYDPDPTKAGKVYCKWIGLLDDIDCFDPLFFSISPAEAEGIDPQHRIFLEEGYKAFEAAGYSQQGLDDRKCGVYLGIMNNEYSVLHTMESQAVVSGTSSSYAIAAARIAYYLNLKGPAIPIDTACSSSLVATHLACQALNNKEIDLALVGGVTLYLTVASYMSMCVAGMLSPEGQCKPFDDGANGFVPGEGVGAIVLKRLSDAEKDHDLILGTIIGSGINQDGRTNGITAPSVNSQTALEREIYNRYQIDPTTISYVEAHGTGTRLGDPIELTALSTAFKEQTERKNYCALGSVKSNIGHTSAAAGVASIHKVLLCLEHKQLVPTLNFTQPNSHFNFEDSPFYVNTTLKSWDPDKEIPRRAAVSSFGFSGTNAHVVIEEYVPRSRKATCSIATNPLQPQVITLSARNQERLKEYANSLLAFIQSKNGCQVNLVDLAYTLQVGREAMEARLGLIVHSMEELEEKLQAFINGKENLENVYQGQVKRNQNILAEFTADEDLQKAMEAWISKRKYHQLLNLWIKGFVFDWNKLYGTETPQRISAPTYPFAKERYWITSKKPQESCIVPSRPSYQEVQKASVDLITMTPLWNVFPVGNMEVLSKTKTKMIVIGGTQWQIKTINELYPHAQFLDIGAHANVDDICDQLSKNDFNDLVWIAPHFDVESLGDQVIIQAQHQGVLRVFQIIKALLILGYDTKELALTVITTATQAIHRTDRVNPTHASVHGLIGTLAKEYPRWKIRLLDIQEGEEWPIQDIFQLPYNPQGNALAYRDKEWFTQILLPVHELPMERAHGKTGGVYVVIGGAGVIGEAWSKWALKKYQAKIIWIGRREKDSDIQNKLDLLSTLGPTPTYIQADAADLLSLQDAYAQIKYDYRQIHGVIHSAIVPLDLSLAEMNEDQFINSLKAKVNVSVCVAQVFAKEALDFVLFFSSINAFGKIRKSGSYAAGCTFKNAFSHQLSNNWSCTVKVMNWGYWKSDEIASNQSYLDRIRKVGIDFVGPKEGMDVLDKFLNSQLDQLVLFKTSKGDEAASEIGEMNFFLNKITSKNEWVSNYPETIPFISLKDLSCSIPETKWVHEAPKGNEMEIEGLLYQLLLANVQPFLDSSEGVLARYYPWLQESFSLLLDKGYLQKQNNGRYSLIDLMPDCENLWKQWDQQKIVWSQDANLKAQVALLEACLQALPEILIGKRQTTDVMFPNATMELVGSIYTGNVISDLFNDALAGILTNYIQERLAQDSSSQIKILEIGAGTGGTTAKLLRALSRFQQAIEEYCYTDLSKAFLMHAEEHFVPTVSYLTTHTLDIEKPIATQQVKGDNYDVVIATNVLHATRSICQTLRNTKATMHKRGILLLNEISNKSLFAHLTFGLLEGWGLYEDTRLRIPGSPGLYPETWKSVLIKEGFDVIFPAKKLHPLGQQIIVAQSDGVIRQQVLITDTTTEKKAMHVQAQFTGELRANSKDVTKSLDETLVTHVIVDTLAECLKVSQSNIDLDRPFSDYGLDSILGISFVKKVNDSLGVAMETSILFDYTTVSSLTNYIINHCQDQIANKAKSSSSPTEKSQGKEIHSTKTESLDPVRPQSQQLRSFKRREKQDGFLVSGEIKESLESSDIAVIGMSGQFPGAKDVHTFWQNLVKGLDGVCELPSQYLDQPGAFTNHQQFPKTNCNQGGILEERDCFDPLFFNLSPKEAKSMNPHQRLILQESWKSLEDAGYNPKNLFNNQISVFVGAEPTRYPSQTFTGSSEAIIASLLSYYLNLKGPACVVNTGCSSSGVAIHLACESLRHKESTMALAGGVFAAMDSIMLMALSEAGMLSPSGRCHTFDDSSDGVVFSEGVGVVVLKRMEDALADRDFIYGVIKGSGVNQNGASNGITAPSSIAQEQLMSSIYRQYQINPEDISYIEAHGTGTKLGDSVEASALVRTFKNFTNNHDYCALGSAKAHIGHTGAAAGVIGLIKILLSLKNHKIPGLLHFKKLNSLINLDHSPFYINAHLEEWESTNDKPLMAALNSFGHSGTNVHLVIQEFIPAQKTQEISSIVNKNIPVLVPLSAKNLSSLKAYAERLLLFLESLPSDGCSHQKVNLINLAYTLQVGREEMKERVIFLVSNLSELAEKLKCFVAEEHEIANCWKGQSIEQENKRLSILTSDEDMQEIIVKWIANGKLRKLAELWALGSSLKWDLLYGKHPPQRISAPTYPFAKERYWEEASFPQVRRLVQSGCKHHWHPLLQENNSNLFEQKYTSTLIGEEFFLSGCRKNGKKVLLTHAAYLEMAFEGVKRSCGMTVKEGQSLLLKNVVWSQPIIVSDSPIDVTIELFPEENGEIFYEIYTTRTDESEEIFVHCQGEAVPMSFATTPPLNLADVKQKLNHHRLEPQAYHMGFEGMGINDDPAYKNLEEVYAGNHEVLVKFTLPASFKEAKEEFTFHPSLLDAVYQILVGLWSNGRRLSGNKHLQSSFCFEWESFEVIDSCNKETMWVWIRYASGTAIESKEYPFAIELYDDIGKVCLRIKGKRYQHEAKVPIEGRDEFQWEFSFSEDRKVSDRDHSNPVEKTIMFIKQLLAEQLQKSIDAIETECSYFDLGLTSLGLFKLAQGIQGKINPTFQATLLFEYKTVLELSTYLAEAFSSEIDRLAIRKDSLEKTVVRPMNLVRETFLLQRRSQDKLREKMLSTKKIADRIKDDSLIVQKRFPELIHLNTQFDGRPVFWFHAGLGSVQPYSIIAEKSQRPFYGIQARGYQTERSPLQGIQAMAAYYLQIIQSVQPEGPYDLGGYSLGGILAYESARQLQELGQKVETLTMLDTFDDIVGKTVETPSVKSEIFSIVNVVLYSIMGDSRDPENIKKFLIHRNDLDANMDDEAFLEQLITLAQQRGLKKAPSQLRESIEHMIEVQRAYKVRDFSILPLLYPQEITCYYFRNRDGLFWGEFEPFYTLGDKEMSVDRTNYWDGWKKSLPNFHIIDVNSTNHMMLLSEYNVYETIIEFCENLYSESGISEKFLKSFKKKTRKKHGTLKPIHDNQVQPAPRYGPVTLQEKRSRNSQ